MGWKISSCSDCASASEETLAIASTLSSPEASTGFSFSFSFSSFSFFFLSFSFNLLLEHDHFLSHRHPADVMQSRS